MTTKRAFPLPLLSGLALIPLAAYAVFSQKQPAPPGNVTLETTVVFGTGGGQPLHLDLTRPRQGEGPFPALVLVHGGGWIGGDKESLRPFQYYFSQRGIVCISIEYRLAPRNPFPAQIEDVKCAVRWLRANASRLHIDTTRIGALGGSAGAHLVALLGTTNDAKKWEGSGGNASESSAICAMVCMSGPYDLALLYRNSFHQPGAKEDEVRGGRKAMEGLLGGTPTQVPIRYQDASPISYASKKSVPTLLTHGPADTLVPIEQAEVFAARLKKVGAEVELLRLEGAGHADFGKKPEEAVARITAFVEKHVVRRTQPTN